MLKLKEYILVCVAMSFMASCGALATERTQAPSPVIAGTQTPELTPTPLPTLTRTPIPTRVVVGLTEVGNFLTISQIFQKHGKPEEIWFSSTGKVPETWPTYVDIVLFYPSENILFIFGGKAKQSKDRDQFVVSICAIRYDDLSVEEFVTTAFTWHPPLLLNFEDLPSVPELDTQWKPLEEVTETNVDDFYSGTLTNPETTCLKTPAEIWPNPDN